MPCPAVISFESIIWFFAGGKPFFAGTILLILAAVITLLTKQKSIRITCYVFQALAIFIIILSTAPLPPTRYVIWLIFFCLFHCRSMTKQHRPVITASFILFCVLMILIELTWHFPKTIAIEEATSMVIIGDSISAGMGNKDEITWPKKLSEMTGVKTINLARAGATVQSALKRQMPQVPPKSGLIILEIGGNDLLQRNTPEQFKKQSVTMIHELQRGGHRVAWFELPLLPQYYRHGRIQRQLAREYGITLIPKSVMAGVFRTENATSDGMHLTEKGHALMAQQLNHLLQIE